MIQFEKKMPNGNAIFYEILDDGYKIYIGQTVKPSIHQYEPYIPDPSKTYEENAIAACESLCNQNPQPSFGDRLTDVEANIDYLMLLTDADSAAEEDK